MKCLLALVALLCALISVPAEARHHHRHHAHRHHHVRHAHRAVVHVSETVVEHPAGCPRRAFCGCGAAVHVFGRPVRDLWLAANWFRFPRAMPAPGMAAVRRHHVFIIEAVLDRGLVLAYDANSGHHATRIHARSIAGYVIVNPRT